MSFVIVSIPIRCSVSIFLHVSWSVLCATHRYPANLFYVLFSFVCYLARAQNFISVSINRARCTRIDTDTQDEMFRLSSIFMFTVARFLLILFSDFSWLAKTLFARNMCDCVCAHHEKVIIRTDKKKTKRNARWEKEMWKRKRNAVDKWETKWNKRDKQQRQRMDKEKVKIVHVQKQLGKWSVL